MSTRPENLIQQYPLLEKTVLDEKGAFKFPDGSMIPGQGFTERDLAILNIFTEKPAPLASCIRSALEPFFPEGHKINGSQAICNLNTKLARKTECRIQPMHNKDGLRYVLTPITPEGIPNPFRPGDFIDAEESTYERSKLDTIPLGQKEVWENQAKIEKAKTAFNFSKAILTATAFKQAGAKLDRNLLTFLKAALPSSSPDRPANLGLLAVNDNRVGQLTREEMFTLFDELIILTQKVIENYWNKNETEIGEKEKNIVRALKQIKTIPGLTPEIIINSVIAHFKPK